MKISHSVIIGFALILLLFTITTIVNFRLYKAVHENADYLSKSSIIIRNSNRFQRNVLNMENGLRDYLLTGERSFIETYNAANAENDSLLMELRPLLADSTQHRVLDDIITLNGSWIEEYMEPLRQAKMRSGLDDLSLDSFKKVYKEKYLTGAEGYIQRQLQQKFKSFTNAEYDFRDNRKIALESDIQTTRKLSIAFTVISIFVAPMVVGLLVRKISNRISVMSGMANKIAAGNYSVHLSDTGSDELSSLGHSLNHMARELDKNIALLQQSNAELDQFAHVVSHDMKGPLRGISNVISWIEEDHREELSPKIAEYIDLIKGRTLRAENLIDGLLAYARIDREAVERESVDVGQLVAEVLEGLPPDESRKISVGDMPVVFTERVLLYQVFSNLIGNAVKHNAQQEARISVYCQSELNEFRFFVADNGQGIDEKYHKRIFQIFQTLKPRDSFESAGVGLAIVKKILDNKKQTITVDSRPGEGAVFSFTWPKN